MTPIARGVREAVDPTSAGSPLFGGYLIAMKHPTSEFGEWCISPKWYFRRHGRIPDTKANLSLPHLDEIMDHVLKSTDGSDGEHLLSRYGIEIERNPIWYFQRDEVPGEVEEVEAFLVSPVAA